MLSHNIETFIACDAEYEDSKIVLFGAPFDSTTSYRPGTRQGPSAIRHESFGLETYSPYQDLDLEDVSLFDSGDIELPMGSAEMSLDAISERTSVILADGKVPFMIGGEHLVTLGAFREVAKRHPEVVIVHFDAHADLRDDYLGVKLSHACVLRRCHDIIGDGRIYQFGIRSGERSEWQWSREGHTFLHPFVLDDVEAVVNKLAGMSTAEGKALPVYLTVDLDVLDPSCFPGTGTPEAGGVTFKVLLDALLTVCGKLNVVACDVNELAPQLDPSGVSTAVAGKIVREMLLALNAKLTK